MVDQKILDAINNAIADAADESRAKAVKKIAESFDEAIEAAEDTARDDGYKDGHEDGKAEAFPFDADDARVLVPILREAYDREITQAPWKAAVITRAIDAFEGVE